MKHLLIPIFYLISLFTYAEEAPGYLGKRLSLGLTVNYCPEFGKNSLNSSGEVTSRLFNTPRIGLRANWIYAPYKSLQVEASYYSKQINQYNPYFEPYYPNYHLLSNGEDPKYSGYNATQIRLTKSKNMQHVAPLGTYKEFGVVLASLSENWSDSKGNKEHYKNYLDFGISTGMGTRRLVGKNFVFESSFQINFFFIGLFNLEKSDNRLKDPDGNSFMPPTNPLGHNFMNSLFNLKVGFSYLL